MKEAEIEEAVKVAQKILVVDETRMRYETRLLARAIVALYNDEIEDDDDDHEAMLRAIAEPEYTTALEKGMSYDEYKQRCEQLNGPNQPAWMPEVEQHVGLLADAYAGKLQLIEEETPLPGSYAEDGWPPWWQTSFDLRGARCRLQVGEMLAQNFHLNQRLLSHDQKPGFLRDLWRRIAGTAWRVTNIRDGVVTVEQGR